MYVTVSVSPCTPTPAAFYVNCKSVFYVRSLCGYDEEIRREIKETVKNVFPKGTTNKQTNMLNISKLAMAWFPI